MVTGESVKGSRIGLCTKPLLAQSPKGTNFITCARTRRASIQNIYDQ